MGMVAIEHYCNDTCGYGYDSCHGDHVTAIATDDSGCYSHFMLALYTPFWVKFHVETYMPATNGPT